jgi:hypothetical protein
MCRLSIDIQSITISLLFVELHVILLFLVIVEIAIPLTQKNAYNGQFSKGYQKISDSDGLHSPLYFDEIILQAKLPLCAAELFLCLKKQSLKCDIRKSEESFQRHSTCHECRRSTLTSTMNITASMDIFWFLRYFNHKSSDGSRPSLFSMNNTHVRA